MAAKREETRPAQHEPTPGPGDGLASERELWARFAEHRDQATREELVRRYLPFAKNLALRYRGASESFDDLLQVASLGLVNAIDRFDPEPRHALHRLRLADHPRRAEAPLPRPGLDRAGAARPARPHGRSRQSDHRADRRAAALALGRRDRRQARGRPGRRARGAGGQPQPPPALARPAGRRRGGRIAGLGVGRRRGRGLRAGRGQAGAGRASCPSSTSASGWSCSCASSRT